MADGYSRKRIIDMEFLIELINSFLPHFRTVVLAIVSLGFLIFIHELGHFYAAKRCGIKVNTFSIGFGPKIVGIQRGGTEYKISVFPFGGYVQMEGENPSEQTGAPGEFASASLGNRAFVVAAGPAINLLFGVLVYGAVFAIGLDRGSANLISTFTGRPLGKSEAVQVGWVADDGPGAAGGILPGDRLVSINGDSIRHWSTFHTRILTSPNKELELVVQRDGVHETLFVKPDAIPSVRGDIGVIRVSSGHTTIVSHIEKGSLAAQAGIQVGDIIESINGERLHSVPFFGSGVWRPSGDWIDEKYKALYNNINAHREALTLGIRRGDEVFTLQLPVEWQVIAAEVQEKSIAEEAGIQNGDMLLTLNGAFISKTTLDSQLMAAADQPVEIGLMRKGELKQVTLSNETQSSEVDPEAIILGLGWQATISGMQLAPETAPLPEYNLLTGFGKGVEATWLTFTAIGRTLQQLIGGEVSPKYLAGPVGITHMTGKFSRLGLSSLIFFVGFISINLAIVNLLPIPIADGGQLLFFALEKIRGKPIPRKAQEIVQQVTVVLLIAFFLYVTWFDGMSLIYELRN
ncbi:RIP metalloprotease RseP [Candidatus Poribacteria bacterium]|nr:RIP metalloprotease RseP [Candidatus Poribacteria bacterium]MYH80574.1 RIP metalloprotease RseP [Candidatus Poribacteria bacterium]MYK95112.1 RIP metalloprotease RseP [Candidatus Poribacteria bacterium]